VTLKLELWVTVHTHEKEFSFEFIAERHKMTNKLVERMDCLEIKITATCRCNT